MNVELEKALLFYVKRGAPKGIVSLYLYSGRANGGTSRESDMDIAVLLDPVQHPQRRDRARLRLRLLSDLIHALRDNHVDLVILNDAPPALGRRVATEWPRVFCADPETDHDYVRDIQLQAADLELFPTAGAQALFEIRPRPFLQLRLAEGRRYLDHLYGLQPRVQSAESLTQDLSLYNDVRFSLLTLAQLVLDVAGEFSVRRGLAFADYSEAVRNLAVMEDFRGELVESLAILPGFRNALLHPHMGPDPEQVVEQLQGLQPVEELLALVARHLEE